MAVVGIDFGTLHSKVCITKPCCTFLLILRNALDWSRQTSRYRYHRQRSVQSRYTVRTTWQSYMCILQQGVCRSLVAFGPKQRFIGEAAKTQETSNFKNTVGSLKRLIGRTLDDVQIRDKEKKFINAKLVDVNGTVGAEVRCL